MKRITIAFIIALSKARCSIFRRQAALTEKTQNLNDKGGVFLND
jgi:hypothetical protein